MTLNLADLDAETRRHMIAELELDVSGGSVYMSRYFTEHGRAAYPELLREAIRNGDDRSLSLSLSQPEIFHATYERRSPKGGVTAAKVPVTAAQTLAEGEFNRYYLRGLCARLIAEGSGVSIEVYRARDSASPRASSEGLIGAHLDPTTLLRDLRLHTGIDTAFGLPPGPNSGLSGRRAS